MKKTFTNQFSPNRLNLNYEADPRSPLVITIVSGSKTIAKVLTPDDVQELTAWLYSCLAEGREKPALETYAYLKPYMEEMEGQNFKLDPVSLEAWYHSKGSKVEHSYRVLEETIRLHKAMNALAIALRNEI